MGRIVEWQGGEGQNAGSEERAHLNGVRRGSEEGVRWRDEFTIGSAVSGNRDRRVAAWGAHSDRVGLSRARGLICDGDV